MRTIETRLNDAINNNRGLVKQSLFQLLNHCETRTGKSGYSGGWAKKTVWTDDVCNILDALKIAYERGNDAPRGGACGEYVRLTSKTYIAKRKKINAEKLAAEMAKAEAARIEALKAAKKAELEKATRNAFTYNKAVKLLANFEYDWAAFRKSLAVGGKIARRAWFELSEKLGTANNDGLRRAVNEMI